MLADGGLVAPRAADGEDARGRTVVALLFGDGAGGDRVDAVSPDESVFSKAALPRFRDRFPGAAGFFVKPEGDVGVIPIVRSADQALAGVCGQLEGGGWEE